MEKDKAPFLRSIILCFNPNFYPFVLRQSGLRSIIYLGLICLLVYGLLAHRFASVIFDHEQERLARRYEAALPDFHFENGQADYPLDKAHIYEENDGDRVSAVIVDTSGKTKELGDKYQTGILITKTEIVIKGPQGRESRQPIPKTAEKVAAKEFFIELLRRQKPRAVLTAAFNVYILQLLAKLFVVALVSGVLLLADKGKAQAYPFGYYFNVGCYSVTPFVLSAFARGGLGGSVATYASYGVSLMLFLSLAVSGLAKCRQEDARELQLAEAHGGAGNRGG